MSAAALTWAISATAVAGVMARPFGAPEAVWAVAGAMLLVLLGLVPPHAALAAAGAGSEVYLFLAGMMLLSEAARVEGLFDWVAAAAVSHAGGSPARLFALVYAAGVVVTAFMSNDATAVLLTPAVFAAARAAGARPLPHLFACALVANAASFVLPISNPANLVLYGGRMPTLGAWLAAFALPSCVSIGFTFALLRLVSRRGLAGGCAPRVARPRLSAAGWAALGGIGGTAALLLLLSVLDRPLGFATALAGLTTAAVVCAIGRRSPTTLATGVAWGMLPLVAGLFVIVAALGQVGAIAAVAAALRHSAAHGPVLATLGAGITLGFASNLLNNLPAGLIASAAAATAQPPRLVVDGLLIGVDLGPNLSVTGSLATILWLSALRREGERVGFLRYLAVGAATMPPALLATLAARVLMG